MQRKGFTLLELLIVMSIIMLLVSILVPCLMSAKERALELLAMEVEVNEDGKVHLEIKDPSEPVENETNSVASVSEKTTATVETVHSSTKEMSSMMTDLAYLAKNLGDMVNEKPLQRDSVDA